MFTNSQKHDMCRAALTDFELIQPVLDFIRQSQKLYTLEEELHDYDQLTRNTLEAQIDFVL